MLFLSSNSGWQPKWKIGSQNKIYLNVILKIIQFVLKDKDLSENYESKILDGSNFCFKNGNKNKTPPKSAQIEHFKRVICFYSHLLSKSWIFLKFQILNLDPNDNVSLHNGRCLKFHGHMVILAPKIRDLILVDK